MRTSQKNNAPLRRPIMLLDSSSPGPASHTAYVEIEGRSADPIPSESRCAVREERWRPLSRPCGAHSNSEIEIRSFWGCALREAKLFWCRHRDLCAMAKLWSSVLQSLAAFAGLRRMRGPRARHNFSTVDTLRANNCAREGALPAARGRSFRRASRPVKPVARCLA